MEDCRDCIVITGAHENNLKNVSLRIPKNKLTVFTGISGSGKSSLVFDTIAVEATRQLQETFPLYLRNRMPHFEPPRVESIDQLTTAIVIDQRPFTGDFRSTVATMTDVAPLLRLLFSRCAEPQIGPSAAYSPNDPQGMCPACGGLGQTVQFDFDKLFDRSKSLNDGAIRFPGHQIGTYQWQLYANSGLFDPDKPLDQFTDAEWQDLLHGTGAIVEIKNTTGKVWNKSYNLTYEGFLDRITRLYLKRDLNAQSKTNQKIIHEFTHEQDCAACGGTRLNPAARGSRLCGKNIAELGDLEISDLIPLLETVQNPVGLPTARKILRVLRGIEDMGLGYLNLNRPARSLSGGEAQRLKMVRHLGSSLVGLTYIFDEPSAGLHPGDVDRLTRLLLGLRDRGNTVLVVEHNKDIIRIADEVVDLGPRAGAQGGTVLFQGSFPELLRQDSLTADNLKKRVPLNRSPRSASGFLTLQNARLHNLKNVSVHIPLHALTAVSGLAGSGKSSLVCGELLRQYPEAVHISQSPIGTTSRSTPATYVGVMDEIRRVFARENGVDAALFSFNSKGACPVCKGKGEIRTEMAFMDPVTVPCEVCHGTRYSEEALAYRYRGKNILEVLDLTIDEAVSFFDQPKIRSKLRTLCHVGMGYMTLGQPTTTLSGGECQRIKLASRLRDKNGVYVMDEPTTGLHGADVDLLMKLLRQLVDGGNTVVVVEHDLDVIRQADWVIDLGPGGGKHGGQVLFEGTPEKLLTCPDSITAQYLRRDLERTDIH
ncbi:excinuclease ABC subunit UvrA [Agathobaculum sp.]|uniref:excinuclease ABC subunit UvrA n=1 Tax=Agathobaculum sp. TaxID=2048138 RepID=UPI002A827D93|nr:excinuclease ABC subunit UvrA [Agathobaculum sp.]MDY3619060.1 excinuclease ABC subunit UvrA [Agathobaculum sp.]